MINAIISAEDKHFQHQGFDVKGILNASITNFKNIYTKIIIIMLVHQQLLNN